MVENFENEGILQPQDLRDHIIFFKTLLILPNIFINFACSSRLSFSSINGGSMFLRSTRGDSLSVVTVEGAEAVLEF